jgi:hypothetical protein
VTRRFVSRFMPATKPLRSSSKRISRLIRRNVGASPFSMFPATCSAKPPQQPRDGPQILVLHAPRIDRLRHRRVSLRVRHFIHNADRRLKNSPDPPALSSNRAGSQRVVGMEDGVVHGDEGLCDQPPLVVVTPVGVAHLYCRFWRSPRLDAREKENISRRGLAHPWP